MTCTEIKEQFVEYMEGLLSKKSKFQFETHLQNCCRCKNEFEKINAINQRLKSDADKNSFISIENSVFNKIVCEQNKKLKQADAINRSLRIVRKIMKSRITKFAVAAVIIFAAFLGITFLNESTPKAYANQMLADAVKAVSNINSIHIKARMRTLPQDNFASIGLEYAFVPIQMWKQTNNDGIGQWRVQKPRRVAIMDGNQTIMMINNNYVVKSESACPNFQCFDLYWCGQLLNVEGMLENELEKAKQNKISETLIRHENIKGKDMLVLEVDSLSETDFSNTSDYLKNKFLSDSDNTKIYYFDPNTKLLKGFKIEVNDKDKNILVFEAIDIEYNQQFDANTFALTIPKDAAYYVEPQVLSEKYQNMGPKEMAAAFFEACAQNDWEEFLKFWTTSAVEPGIKSYLGGLEIISLGEPFQSGNYAGWFVPYEIKLKNGSIKKHNLAVRKDNKAGRYIVDGGI